MDCEQRVKKIIADELGAAEGKIKNTDSFTEDLGADSLDCVQLIMRLEDEFGISIPDNEAAKLLTVEAVLRYIEAKDRPSL